MSKSKRNLFIDYTISDDIKTEILFHFQEHEIHGVISHLDCEWNKLCKQTFDNRKFRYTFTCFCEHLMSTSHGSYVTYPIILQNIIHHTIQQNTNNQQQMENLLQ